MNKYILLFIFLFIPIFINAQSCNKNDIVIKSVTVDNSSGNASEKSDPVIDDKNIKLDLSMSNVNDIITYKVVIENNSKEDYELNNIVSKSEYIDYSFDGNESNVVKGKSTKEVYLKAEFKKDVPANLFNNAGYNASSWNIGTLKIYASKLTDMFFKCRNISAILNIYKKPTSFGTMLNSSATNSATSIVVNYTSVVTNIDNIVATKSSNSNVTKGDLIE